jgi:hypothetical protein
VQVSAYNLVITVKTGDARLVRPRSARSASYLPGDGAGRHACNDEHMYLWLILALIFALLEVIAVSKNLGQLEYIAKPAVMIGLFLWLYTTTGLQGNAFWFGLGIVFSLLGDVLLLVSLERMFLPGLVAFLFAHVFYIAGLAGVNWERLLHGH